MRGTGSESARAGPRARPVTWRLVRVVRFALGDQVSFGVLEVDDDGVTVVQAVRGHPFAPMQAVGAPIGLGLVRLLAPMIPSKIVAFGRTYAAHAAELGNEVPSNPLTFLKPATSVCGPGDPIVLPAISNEVSYEAELAVVIGRICKDVPAERALDVVLGYTAANDVSARDLQRSDGQWGRAKSFDTFCPLGPWIETDLDPTDVAVQCRLDGELVQNGRTSSLLITVAQQIAIVSQVMTLLPGDIILTGTPQGVGQMVAGQTVEVIVESIGTLTNPVIAGAPVGVSRG